MSTATLATSTSVDTARVLRRNTWGLSLVAAFAVLLIATKLYHPSYGSFELESLAQAALPIALAAVA